MMWSKDVILSIVGVVVAIVSIVAAISSICYHRNFVLPVARSAIYKASRLHFFLKHYGPIGIALWCFASREVWQIQLQVMRSVNDADATDYKKSAQEDSSIVAVAVSP